MSNELALCTVTPLAIATEAPEGWKLTRFFTGSLHNVSAPPGYTYLPVQREERPTDFDRNTHRAERLPDHIDGGIVWRDRWHVVPRTDEEIVARVVPKEVPAWRIRVVAKLTPYGAGTLHDAVVGLINQLEDPAHRVAAEEIYLGGNLLDRESALLQQVAAALQLPPEQVHAIFIAAAALET